MELVVRIAQVDDMTARKFQPERAIISHYQLAHFHKIYTAPPADVIKSKDERSVRSHATAL
jgi:hypothetical protein